MVVAKAELAQSYMHQLKMVFRRSFSIGPFYLFSNQAKRFFSSPPPLFYPGGFFEDLEYFFAIIAFGSPFFAQGHDRLPEFGKFIIRKPYGFGSVLFFAFLLGNL